MRRHDAQEGSKYGSDGIHDHVADFVHLSLWLVIEGQMPEKWIYVSQAHRKSRLQRIEDLLYSVNVEREGELQPFGRRMGSRLRLKLKYSRLSTSHLHNGSQNFATKSL